MKYCRNEPGSPVRPLEDVQFFLASSAKVFDYILLD